MGDLEPNQISALLIGVARTAIACQADDDAGKVMILSYREACIKYGKKKIDAIKSQLNGAKGKARNSKIYYRNVDIVAALSANDIKKAAIDEQVYAIIKTKNHATPKN